MAKVKFQLKKPITDFEIDIDETDFQLIGYSVQKWIKASECLPKNSELKIVAIKDESDDSSYTYTTFGWYLKQANCWIVDNEMRTDVYAWMVLPWPPKEEQI